MAPKNPISTFKSYKTPASSRRAPNYPWYTWKLFWADVEGLIEDGLSQNDVVRKIASLPLAKEKGFHPTLPQLERQLRLRRKADSEGTAQGSLRFNPKPAPTTELTAVTRPVAASASRLDTSIRVKTTPSESQRRPLTPVSLGESPSLTSGSTAESPVSFSTSPAYNSVNGLLTPPPEATEYPFLRDLTIGSASQFGPILVPDSSAIDPDQILRNDAAIPNYSGATERDEFLLPFKNGPKEYVKEDPLDIDAHSARETHSSWSFERNTKMRSPRRKFRQPLRLSDLAKGMVDHGRNATELQTYLKRCPAVLRQHPEDFFIAAMHAAGCDKFGDVSKALNCMSMVRVFNLLGENAEEFYAFLDALVAKEAKHADAAQAKRASDFWGSCAVFFSHIQEEHRIGQEYDAAGWAIKYADLETLLSMPISI